MEDAHLQLCTVHNAHTHTRTHALRLLTRIATALLAFGAISHAVWQVTGMARQMVINYGMSDIGPWSLLDPSAQSGDVVMRMMARNSMSENLQQRIDDAVKTIAADAYEVALAHIRDNRCVRACVCGCAGLLAASMPLHVALLARFSAFTAAAA